MLKELFHHLDQALTKYTQNEYLDVMKIAKEKYFSMTGKLDEDTDEFEARMNCFNDWYLFQFPLPSGGKIIEDYLRQVEVSDDLAKALHNLNHSVFEFQKKNFKGHIVLNDILHGKKLTLDKSQDYIGLMQGDVFTGRVITLGNFSYLLKGTCLLPLKVLSSLKKQSKLVRKKSSFDEELKFLLQLESLKTKSLNYSHIDPQKIFIFS